MTPSKVVGDLQRLGIKFGHELNHLEEIGLEDLLLVKLFR